MTTRVRGVALGSASPAPHPELAMRSMQSTPHSLDGIATPASDVSFEAPRTPTMRQLPKTPSRASSVGSEPTIGLNMSVSTRLNASSNEILICPFGCTAMGDSTQLACLRCGLVYCMACLRSDLGQMYGTDSKGRHCLICADCGGNPRTVPLSQRPAWQGRVAVSETKSKPILPSVGSARQAEDRVWQKEDSRAWMTSLRSETPTSSTTPPGSRPRSATPHRSRSVTPSEKPPMPAVFDRLTSVETYGGMHKHRFSKDGVGRGLAGRRDDDSVQKTIAGQGQITRDSDPDMDTPTAPKARKLKRAVSSGNVSSMDAYTDPVMLHGVYSRLVQYSPAQSRRPGEYETTRKAAQPFSVPKSVAKLHAAAK
eukprot:m.113747 g.113747  ORF g.113747 m.113747 type:complete len:368 (+) comp16011_c0_seq4:482-1585(+)